MSVEDLRREFSAAMLAHTEIGSTVTRLVRPSLPLDRVAEALGADATPDLVAWYGEHDGTENAKLGEMAFFGDLHLVGAWEARRLKEEMIRGMIELANAMPDLEMFRPRNAWPLVTQGLRGMWLDLESGDIWELGDGHWYGPLFESIPSMLRMVSTAIRRGIASVDRGLLDWDYDAFKELASAESHRFGQAWQDW